jgi:hypothetical protein
MTSRDEIIEVLMAAAARSGRPDITLVIEGFADQLVLINDEHHRQVALAKAEIDVLKREMAFAKLTFDGVVKTLSLGLQGVVSESIDAIDQSMSQPADAHAEYATKLAQAKEKFDQEIAALRQELTQAYQELAMPRTIDGFAGSGRSPNDGLN